LFRGGPLVDGIVLRQPRERVVDDLSAFVRAGRISIARTQRGSVTPEGVERLSHASCACAGIVKDGERTIRSGGPPNSLAKFHTDAVGPLDRGRHVLRIALRRARVDPSRDHVDLVIVQRAIVLDSGCRRSCRCAMAAFAAPRHAP